MASSSDIADNGNAGNELPEGDIDAESVHGLNEICTICRQAFASVLQAPEVKKLKRSASTVRGFFDVNHHQSLKSLLSATEEGCSLCGLFQSVIRRNGDQPDRDEAERHGGLTFSLRFYYVDLDFDVAPVHSATLTFLLLASTGDERSQRAWGFEFLEYFGSVPFFTGRHVESFPPLQLSKQWLKSCQACHKSCPPIKDRELPTRVLDVGSKKQDPKLVDSADISGGEGCYVALSHCWGSRPPDLLLTSLNLRSHLNTMPFHTLAKNFQDAITVTRFLGYRYLWIDSLCIIQDSEADWQVQCSRMEMVYANAALTIAAAAAPDAHEGFLRQRTLQDGEYVNSPFQRRAPSHTMSKPPVHRFITQIPLEARS